MSLFEAFVLGLVQGLTEFIPISSTAHLRIVPHFLGWGDPGAAFSAVIQLGTLLSVFIYFRKDVFELLVAFFQSVVALKPNLTEQSRLAWAIGVGTIPIVVLGLGFKDFIETEARDLRIIGTSLIVLALLLYLSEKVSKPRKLTKDLGFLQVQFIGLCQALALIPGCSRSGSTIMGGLFLGMTREEAARFSFLLGLPAILGSGLFELKELADHGLGETGWINVLVGILAAFVSGYLSIEFLLQFLKRYGTLLFVVYRVILGASIWLFWV